MLGWLGCWLGEHRWREVAAYTLTGWRLDMVQCADCGVVR